MLKVKYWIQITKITTKLCNIRNTHKMLNDYKASDKAENH